MTAAAVRPTMLTRIINSVRKKDTNSQTNSKTHLRSGEDNERYENGHLPERNPYSRPMFLALDKSEEAKVLDVKVRPIMTTSNENSVPLRAGYAECVNGGKSSKNEDQAAVGRFRIINPPDDHHCKTHKVDVVEVHYFGIFDGHAGPGAALMAADQLINHLQEKLVNVQEYIFSLLHEKSDSSKRVPLSIPEITLDDLVVGALEAAFVSFDEQVARERTSFSISGGCAAVVAIILQEKLYVAHAGDCRAVAYIGEDIQEMAVEFTPETDSDRIQTLAHLNPSLTHDIFSDKIFEKFINKRDIGNKVLYKAPNHRGWQSMKIAEEDLKKSPLVIGQGKWAKLMGIIGVARGFGDHDLKVPNTDIRVKPFLTPAPEVRILNLVDLTLQDDDVLVMGCDGLWDLVNNEQMKTAVRESLAASQDENSLPSYTKAAESVVHLARGDDTGRGWKMSDGSDASFDDICAFVIPLCAACQKQGQNSEASNKE